MPLQYKFRKFKFLNFLNFQSYFGLNVEQGIEIAKKKTSFIKLYATKIKNVQEKTICNK